jgi:hypothetical protein
VTRLIALALAAAALYAFLRRRPSDEAVRRYPRRAGHGINCYGPGEPCVCGLEDDGVQPPDPRPLGLTYTTGPRPSEMFTDTFHADPLLTVPRVPYTPWYVASCGCAHPWGICTGHAG